MLRDDCRAFFVKDVVMDEQRILSATEQRTRRNMIKMGAIVASAGVAARRLTKVVAVARGPRVQVLRRLRRCCRL